MVLKSSVVVEYCSVLYAYNRVRVSRVSEKGSRVP